MIKAKKSLGQNFLIDDKILEKITNSADIYSKTILEIGPGSGNLTSYLLKKKPKKIIVNKIIFIIIFTMFLLKFKEELS